MSGTDRNLEDRDCGGDVAAYALGALEPPEVDAFLQHLESCTICRDELATFQDVVDLLPMSAPLERAPADLRRRVLRAVEGEPVRAESSRRPARARPWLSGWAVPRPALALGAVLAIAVIAFVGVRLGSSSSGSTRVIQAQVTGKGTAQLKIAQGHGQLIVHHFAPPPAGQIYEVWLERPKGAPSPTTALFSVTASGDGDVEVPGSLRGVATVMVTPEPAGGSPKPTHPAVISASLT
jgi:anti-sigma-K factor RskA